jgi:hypothetical protein
MGWAGDRDGDYFVVVCKDVGLLPTQLIALVVATILLAGLCVWIIGWEDNDESPSSS